MPGRSQLTLSGPDTAEEQSPWPTDRTLPDLLRAAAKDDEDEIPEDEDLDQVLPVGDMSIFDDLGLDEMEIGAISADLDLYPEDAVAGIAERLRFGDVVERALDAALEP